MLIRFIEIMWLVIAIASIAVFFYLLLTEGFVAGKAWVYLITTAIATGMFLLRRWQRIRQKK
ncbi:MAG: hypothetical protein ACO1PI_06925 [Bacteroidota bacterium]